MNKKCKNVTLYRAQKRFLFMTANNKKATLCCHNKKAKKATLCCHNKKAEVYVFNLRWKHSCWTAQIFKILPISSYGCEIAVSIDLGLTNEFQKVVQITIMNLGLIRMDYILPMIMFIKLIYWQCSLLEGNRFIIHKN